MWGIWPENIKCNVMRWHRANHLLEVTGVTEQRDVTDMQCRVNVNAGCSSPLHSFIPPHTYTLTSNPLSHLDLVPMATHQPSIWVVSHSVWPRGMTGYDEWRYSIRAITCYCTVWWPSLFFLCLSLLLSISFLPPSFVCLLLIIPFVLSPYSQPLPPNTSAHILCPCTCRLHLYSFLFFVSLSAAMLWRCSDLQPSLDRVRSASTTCLRPDTNFHSPDRERYKKKILNAVYESSDFNLHKILIFYFQDEYRNYDHRLLCLQRDQISFFFSLDCMIESSNILGLESCMSSLQFMSCVPFIQEWICHHTLS